MERNGEIRLVYVNLRSFTQNYFLPRWLNYVNLRKKR